MYGPVPTSPWRAFTQHGGLLIANRRVHLDGGVCFCSHGVEKRVRQRLARRDTNLHDKKGEADENKAARITPTWDGDGRRGQ